MERNNKNGITLIALIVTIVILLILAGIAISQISGDNGLFIYAKRAKNNTLEAQELENVTLADYDNKINQYIDGSRSQINIDEENYTTYQGTVVTNDTPYGREGTHDIETKVNSYIVERSGMYYINGHWGYGGNSTSTGYLLYCLNINSKVVNYNQKNSINLNWYDFDINYVTLLKKGDVVHTSVCQKASNTTITGYKNILTLNPIYYTD